jgi:putative tricarboxylic transport membrane protein
MVSLGQTFDNVLIGLQTALSFSNLLYCFIGVVLGTLLGVLPGIGALVAVSLLFPITFHLDPTASLVMLAGIFYGTAYGGSTSSILLNVPGTPSHSVTCLDGYPLAKQGRAGVALFGAHVAAFVGGSIGIILMMLFSPLIVQNALQFGPQEYFSLMVLGLVAASSISSGSPAKGIAMVVVGILLGLVQADFYSSIPRFNFGIQELYEGISLVALAMGLFGVPEVIVSVRMTQVTAAFDRKSITFRSMLPTRDDIRRSWMPMLRGTAIGSFFGTLPGTGSLIASFMAYALEKKVSRDSSRFGKGAIEGIMAPEAANNAADMTAFIPTMTLGIPGSPAMAIMLAVMIIHGMRPGPNLVVEQPALFWGVVMSFWIGNVLLVVLNIPMIGIWVRLLTVPYRLLYPAILIFVVTGVYSINNSTFDVWVLVFFSAFAYAMRILDFPTAPLILGFVLGPDMEEHFRRALLISRGNFMTFLDRPLSGTIMVLTLMLLIWSVWSARRSKPRLAED